MASHELLCLKCRDTGHTVSDCFAEHWQAENAWMFSEARKLMRFQYEESSYNHSPCNRCVSLDLVTLLNTYPPADSQSELEKAMDPPDPSFIKLGKTGSVQFWNDCPVCRCIFAITPNPRSSEQEIVLITDWSICRLAGEHGVVLDNEDKRHYTSCLLSVLRPSSLPLPFPVQAHRGDAVAIVETDLNSERTLGGRQIRQDQVDIDRIKSWIGNCTKRHGSACAAVQTPELHSIRLIDVQQRRIVPYPQSACDYVALSYVWGGISPGNYKTGDVIPENNLPRTLEDAIAYTCLLGKRYLWIDSLCIDQSDDDDKADQIARMWSIYRGAWVTLIVLSGTTADSGIPGLSRSEHYPQVECSIGGKRLVGLMPTLSQQNWVCPWSQRAWTFQEALLSLRCLYVSDHQAYYDCSVMQCSESLEECKSWGHRLTQTSAPPGVPFETWMMAQIGWGGYRNILDSHVRRLDHWGAKVTLYSYRTLTYDDDALRAFDGVLQYLRGMYPKGFHQGLPIEDFDWGLLWWSQWPPQRRKGFPSWSWAAWKGGIYYGQPADVSKTRRFPLDLEIQCVEDGTLKQIFKTNVEFAPGIAGIWVSIHNDPIDKAAKQQSQGTSFNLDKYPNADKLNYLFINAVCLRFVPEFGQPQRRIRIHSQYETFTFTVCGIQCALRIISTDRQIALCQQRKTSETFIVLGRYHAQGAIVHSLMLIQDVVGTDIVERATVLELVIPFDQLQVLEDFNPHWRRIVLA